MISLRHTSEMEKGMHQSHGISYAEYERSLEKRLKVERAREASHQKCAMIAAEHDYKLTT